MFESQKPTLARRTFTLLHSLFLLIPFTVASASAEDRPNIILIMADDMGYECLSSNGGSPYQTPHLDRLAKSGVRFRHCYSQPLCTPSRVQIMTGQYNYRNYVKFGLLEPGQRTFGHVLKEAGYRTAIAGKWQLGGDSESVKKFGFDRHCLWHLKGRGSRFWEPIIVQDSVEMTEKIKDRFGPDVFADFIVDFITEKNDKPFFVYFPMALVHWPFVPTPDSKPGGSRERLGKYDGRKGGVEYFPDMVAYCDKIVGRIDKKLKDLGVRDNTILLFTGDNGNAINISSQLKGRPIQGGKAFMTDPGDHVPLVVSWPNGIKKPHVSDALVNFSDFLPTFADVAKASIDKKIPCDGFSFLSVLTENTLGKREWTLCHYNPRPPKRPKNEKKLKVALKKANALKNQKKLGRYIRNQRFKLFEDGRFFDVSKDFYEKSNILKGKAGSDGEKAREAFQKIFKTLPEFKVFLNE